MRAIKTLVAVLVLGVASLASAERDTFFLGDGGDLLKDVSGVEILNKYAAVTQDLASGSSTIPVDSTAGFEDVRLVLVLHTLGSSLGDMGPLNLDMLDDGRVGRWELARLSGVSNSPARLNLAKPLLYNYRAGQTQVVSVPQYRYLRVRTTGRIAAQPWDGAKGGVIALLIQTSLVNDGTISTNAIAPPDVNAAAATGLRGAAFNTQNEVGSGNGNRCASGNDSVQKNTGHRGEGLQPVSYNSAGRERVANAGGGGVCERAGGGGGGGRGAGGNGGRTAGTSSSDGGQGGLGTNFDDTPFGTWRLVLGGGGGSGHDNQGSRDVNSTTSNGGAGGGAIFIRTGSLIGSGSIRADGNNGRGSTTGGGGGGGAGGTIIMRVAGSVSTCPSLSAKGGDGGSSGSGFGPGGGGGGGSIFFQALPINACTATITAGQAGRMGATTDVNGASPGGDGFYTLEPEELEPAGDAVVRSVSPVRRDFVYDRRPTVVVRALAGRKVYLRFDNRALGQFPLAETPRVDDPGYSDYSGQPAADLADGNHTVVAVAEYKGLWGFESVPTSFQVDASLPDTILVTTPPSLANSRTARFVFDSTEGNVTFQCNLNNTSWESCSREITYGSTRLTADTHNLKVKAVDLAGNEDDTPATYDWTIDTGVPAKPVVTTPGAGSFVANSRPAITGTSSESGGTVTVYIDDVAQASTVTVNGGRWSFPTSAFSGPLGEGLRHVQVTVTDSAGNVSPFSDTVSFTVDTVPPTVSIIYPAVGTILSDNPLVVRGTAEPGSTVAVTVSRGASNWSGSVQAGVVGNPGEWRYEVAGSLMDGTYVVTVTAIDLALNATPQPTTRSFILDRRPPSTTLACPSRFTKEDTVNFTVGTADEPAARYECVVNGDFVTTSIACPSSLSKSAGAYTDGEYTLLARAIDAVGNVDPTPAACTWTWDQAAPTALTISEGPPPVTNSQLAVFRFSATDALSSPVLYECSLDSAAFAPCSNPYATTVATGPHTLAVRAMDQAGNVTGTVSRSWAVDTGLPVARILPAPGARNPTNSLAATFLFELKVPISTPVEYYYILNNTTTTNLGDFTKVVGTSATITVTGQGSHRIRVLARDPQRNVETPIELQEVYDWVVDQSPPAVELVGKPSEWERFTTAGFEVSAPRELSVAGFLCSLSDCVSSGPEPRDCLSLGTGQLEGARASYQMQEGIREGRNCIQVWAQDRAGNLSAQPARHEWNVDRVAPEPPVIDTQQGELRVASRFPAVEGRSEPYTEIALLFNNGTEPVARANANEQGRWRAQITQEVADGTHNLRAWAKDRAGNEGPTSAPVTLLVDSQLPTSVIGGGLSCAASGGGGGGVLLALLGLAGLWGGSGRRQRGWQQPG